MDTRARRLSALILVTAVAFGVSGCGGEDPAAATGTPTPGATDGTTVAAPGTDTTATGATTDTTAAASATIPSLIGDDIGGGLLSGSAGGLFSPQATDPTTETTVDTETETTDAVESTTTTEATVYSGAVLSVDGVTFRVASGGTFPKGDPVFRLLTVSGADIEVELVAGEFTSDGGQGLFLDKGDMVSLVNATEQTTYKVQFVRGIEDAEGIDFG